MSKLKVMKKRAARVNVNEPCTKAGQSPSAQNVALLKIQNKSELLRSETVAKLELLRSHSFNAYVFASLQLRHALRVSELLNTTPGDIDALGRLRVCSLKGGAPRIVALAEFEEYVLSLARMGSMPWTGLDRFYLNRLYLKVGIQINVEGGKRRSVTHALRHISAELLGDTTEDLRYAQSLLAHKSNSQTPIYVHRKTTKVLHQEGKISRKDEAVLSSDISKERAAGDSKALGTKKKKKS